MSNPLSRFWSELRRRKVIRMAVAYVVVGWVVVEVSSVILPTLLLPDWSVRLVTVLVLLGFPAALVLAWVLELTPEGVRRESAGGGARRKPPVDSPVESPRERRDDRENEDSRRSIVVLPFANLSDEPGQGYFSDGITEEILGLLSRQPDLRVVSRTTSFSFRDSREDLRSIAARLGVEMVLEGSVRRAGSKVRIMAQLIDPETDAQLWSDRFDRELIDVFAVQAEIARSIVDALQLDPDCCPELPATQTIEAYEYYLRGRQYFHTLTQASLRFARQMFRRAIEVDPGYARAWAGLADTESMVASWFEPAPEHIEAANEASRRALELAPELPEAHAARGHALTIDGDYAGAAREFERALEIDPNDYEALYQFGRSRFAEGRLRDAADLWQRAHSVQPDEFEAVALREGVIATLGSPEAHRAAVQEALGAIVQRLALNPDDQRALALGGGLLVSAGRVDEAIEMAERLIALAPDDGTTLYNVACMYARARMKDRALDFLRRRIDLGWINREWLKHDSDLDCLRDDPRFKALLERID